MHINPFPPFDLSKEPDGTQHAISGNVQVTVLPDFPDLKINHRVGQRAATGGQSRWLHIDLGGQKVFVNGNHVVITTRDLVPSFEKKTNDEWSVEALRYIDIIKDERGRYIVDTPENQKVISEAIEKAVQQRFEEYKGKARYEVTKALDAPE